MATKTVEPKAATTFTKDRLVASEKYARYRDLLNVLLEDGKEYTDSEVQTALDGFLHKKID